MWLMRTQKTIFSNSRSLISDTRRPWSRGRYNEEGRSEEGRGGTAALLLVSGRFANIVNDVNSQRIVGHVTETGSHTTRQLIE